MLKRLHVDFETYSECDLKSSGMFRYAEDPSTEALILAFSDGDSDPVGVDLTRKDYREKLTPLFRAIDKGCTLVAHNAQFEMVIWQMLHSRGVFPVLPKLTQWNCTAARARMLAIPGSLKGAANALGVGINKDAEGDNLIQVFSKPGKKGRIYPLDQPEAFQRFIDYCRQDVRVEIELDKILPDLDPVEQRAFILDFKINSRGMPVNIELVRKADQFVEEYSEGVLRRATEIAGCSPTQREKTIAFLASRGIEVPNLQAATVEALAERPGLPDDLVELLDSRIELSRAGTKKLKAIQNSVSDDSRIRGGFLFSAASTRRWSSVGVQMHNLQKPSGDTNPEVLLDLLAYDPSTLPDIFPRPLTALAQSVRAFFESPTNFLVADYSSVEPRGLAWTVDETWMVDAYKNKQDAYKIAASKVYKTDPTRIDDKQRFMGKQLVLGCFDCDTAVLTNSGWKRIVDITLDDRVFDGVEFVEHQGVAYMGEKEVIEVCGVKGTPDHRIWNGHQWFPLKNATQEQSPDLRLALEVGASSYRRMQSLRASFTPEGFATAGGPISAGWTPSSQGRSINAQRVGTSSELELKLDSRMTTGGYESSSAICGPGSPTREKVGTDRPTSTPGFQSATDGRTSRTSAGMSLASKVGEPCQSLTEETTSRVIPQRTADSSITQSPTGTLSKVFDIVNCGPRSRYLILTDVGPLIVHNCNYAMGAKRFIETCAKFGRNLSLEEAQEAVTGYRQSVPKIVQSWRSTERACIRAIRSWKPVVDGKLTFRPETLPNGFPVLYVDMPSGTIAYPQPSLGFEEWNGEKRETFEFYTPLGSGWVKTDTHGGSLVENWTQALTRDVLRDGMLAADDAGFSIVGHCHDEAIAEGDPKDLKEFERLLCSSSEWATGFPIGTEGYAARRYRK